MNDKTLHINPYGIDVEMMIEFCNGNVHDFQKQGLQTMQDSNPKVTFSPKDVAKMSINQISVFKPKNECPIIVQRRTDILTVVTVSDNATTKANDISATAAKQPNVPYYNADGAGSILIFHTESGEFVLGGTRNNPAIENELTKNKTPFPKQINATIGGYLANPELPLRKAVIDAIKNKMFLTAVIPEGAPGFEEQNLLKQLCDILDNNDGWENQVCMHTDKWINKDNTLGTMCFLTTIKHINCSNAELAKIDEALQIIMAIKKTEGANPRTLSEFKFVPLQPVITNSLATYSEDEITKARSSYEQFGDTIALTFNDLAVATLAKNGAFKATQYAQLELTHNTSKNTI